MSIRCGPRRSSRRGSTLAFAVGFGLLTGLAARAQTGAGVPYFTDFEAGLGPEWSTNLIDASATLNFTRFLGRFSNAPVVLTLTNLSVGQSYTLGFDFLAIDSWDGSSGVGDYFNVSVNGVQVFHETFSNYNGEPPVAAQSYPRRPDSGRVNLGFETSLVDAIYRDIEIVFVAASATTQLSFSGQNLQALGDESWGLDHVGVRLTSELAVTQVRSSTVPAQGSTNNAVFEGFTLVTSRDLLTNSAAASSNYALRGAGANGTLGDGDDVLFPLTAVYGGLKTVALSVDPAQAPLQPGAYRFSTLPALLDRNTNAVAVFTRDFLVANPAVGRIESLVNDTLANATALPLAETPGGSGFLTAAGLGSFASTTDVDYWRFDAEAGDHLNLRLEAEQFGVSPQVFLQNGTAQNLVSANGGSAGVATLQQYVFPSPGTYYLRILSTTSRSRYQFRVDLGRAAALETEPNDTQAAANSLAVSFGVGLFQGRLAGALPAEDTVGDFVRLPFLNPGNAISVSAQFPDGSLLTGPQVSLAVFLEGNSNPLTSTNAGSLSYTAVSNGVHYVRIATTNRSWRAQYVLNVAVSDGVPPQVLAASLPEPGATTTAVLDRFTLTFSEEMSPSVVSNSANYDLRAAGADGSFGTGDDPVYLVVSDGYAGGVTAAYLIGDGPLQPGNYRLTVTTNLVDRANNRLASVFVRQFFVAGVAGFTVENRTNDVWGLATPLLPGAGGAGDGTLSLLGGLGIPGNPEFVAAGLLNGDTNLDLVTANFGADGISVLLGNGAGAFQMATNIPTGDGAVSLVLRDLNGDTKLDLAVANYNGDRVTILLGDGLGGFQVLSNLTGFNNPYNLAVADLNNDGKPDLIVPNYVGGNISVLLGVGDGTFLTRSNYVTGSNPQTVAVGDLNGDGKPDLAVANYGSSTVSVLFGNGNGTFQPATNLVVGANPRFVAIAEVTGDSSPDLVVLNSTEATVAVLRGNGNGTFQPRQDYATGTSDPYQLQLADLNGDGRADIIVMGYGNNRIGILRNDGAGGFGDLVVNTSGSCPIGGAAGDFNGDGRIDLAFVYYCGNALNVWLGNGGSSLVQDPPGSGLRSGQARGNLSSPADLDFYRFTGVAGDQVSVAVEVPGYPSPSSLNYQLQTADGTVLRNFFADGTGWGQSLPIALPYTGTYLVRVASSQDYRGEYRVRVTAARPPTRLEAEPNNAVAQANPLGLSLTNGHQQASVAGYLSAGDSAGDFFGLGNLSAGTVITLSLAEPSSSGVAASLGIVNAAGATIASSPAGATNFAFTVPPGQDGYYYARVTAGAGGYAGSSAFALSFDGTANYVDVGAWSPGSHWTVEAWVRPSAAPAGRHTIAGGLGACFDWGIAQQNGELGLLFRPPGGCSQTLASGVTPLLNSWYHLAGSSDGSIARVYVDGLVRNTASVEPEYVGTTAGTRIGGAICCGGDNFPGLIDEVRIWNRALAADEIATNRNRLLTGAEPGLVGYWRFNEGFGTSTVDLSGQGRTGTLNGPAWVGLGPTNAQSPGLLAQYLLGIDLQDAQAPSITAVTLPSPGSTNNILITGFDVSFNEDMDPAFNALNRDVFNFGGHQYLLTDTAGTWAAGEAQAVALGGHLAAVNSPAENAWLSIKFAGNGNLWIGLSDQAAESVFTWSSGESLTYSNWNAGEPNNIGNEDFVFMTSGGRWLDSGLSPLRGIIEVPSAVDTDGDGLVDALDPFPADPLNAFDLRAAGPDGQFGTPDDVVYRLNTTGYAAGVTASFVIVDGPLQPGAYRFTATTSLRDRFGNALASPFVRLFTILPVNGFVIENRANDTQGQATSLSVAPGSNPDGSFLVSSNLAAGPNPYFIVAGQFTADTNLDLLVANFGGGNVGLNAGNGDGSFQAQTNFATGSGAVALATGDFNGDTKLDVAVANYTANTVSVLLGNGNGSFQLASNYAGFSTPYALASADLNNDGKLDLVIPNYGNGTVRVLLGVGDGSFVTSSNYLVNGNPETVAVGDVNEDGKPDLLVANYGSSVIHLLLGNGNGTFQIVSNLASGLNPRSLALGYLNNDAHLDLVMANSGDNNISVAFGNGDGTFQARSNYLFSSSDTYQLVLTDLNGDGRTDIVAPSYGNNRLLVFLNSGDGTFGTPSVYFPGGNPIAVAAGDFNRDGLSDLATANYSGASVTLFFGNNEERLTEDPVGSGAFTGTGRGRLSDDNDQDYWSFSGQAGDRVTVAVEVPGNPSASSLSFSVFRPDNGILTSFSTTSTGYGQSVPATLPVSGTYAVRVTFNNSFHGEYRLRVALARAPVQLETEPNDTTAQANAPLLALVNGRQQATMLGYFSVADTAGDYYRLGNLAAGSQVTLGFRQPASSGIVVTLGIYNGSGLLQTNSVGTATNLTFVVPAGADGAYYARIGPGQAGHGGGPGFSVALDGLNDAVTFGAAVIPASGDFTVECWAYANDSGGFHEILSQGTGGNAFYLGFDSGNFIRAGDGWPSTGVGFPLGAWHHFAVVKNATNALLYVDGVLAGTRGAPIPNPSAANPLVLGKQYGGNAEYWPGWIDEVRIWSTARSAAQIQQNLNIDLPGTEPGLAGYWRFDEGSGVVAADTAPANHPGTLVNGPLWAADGLIDPRGPGLLAQYLLDFDLADTLPPSVTAATLPAEGSVSTAVLDRLTLSFSEDMNPGTVTNSASYELRGAGGDGIFGNGDDDLYAVISSPVYATGLSGSYVVNGGPLQPGLYRFSARTNLTDRAGNALAAVFVRNFAVSNLTGFVLESRQNDQASLATFFGSGRTNLPDGSFTEGASTNVGAQPYYLVAGRLNGDTNLDLAVANSGSGTVSILLGAGDGTFQVRTNLAAGSSPRGPVLGFFNSDSNLDLAVANFSSGTVSVFLGNGDGTFQPASNYVSAAQPQNMLVDDFNGDLKPDLAAVNFSGSISIWLGNGDGTFQARTDYASGGGAIALASGDVNGDGLKDLVVANSGDDNLSLFLGNGNGTFATALRIAANATPRALVLRDLNQDGKLDLAVANAGDNTVSVYLGNGNGSFQPRTSFASGTSDTYFITAADWNRDGLPDLAVSGYGNSRVSIFLARGGGLFEAGLVHVVGNRPIGLAAGDYNNDGRVDLAMANYSGNNVTVLLANDTEPLAVDFAGGLLRQGAGRGNLAASTDADYWSFSAQADDRLLLSAENPGNPASSGLHYSLYRPDGQALGDFYADSLGHGQGAFTLPVSGTYALRVEENFSYRGEYRFRATLARRPVQLELEPNDSVGGADVVTFEPSIGHQTATVLGAVPFTVGAGDFFRLGNLTPGVTINASYVRPDSSGLVAALQLQNSSGATVAASAAGATSLSYTVTNADAYFVSINSLSNSASLTSLYLLTADLMDTAPPAIASLTLPGEGAATLSIVDRFSLEFSEDLDVTINRVARDMRVFNGHAYLLTAAAATWANAEAEARSFGGHLVTINDAAENSWVRDTFSGAGNLWLGLTDEAAETNFVWVSGEAFAYSNWNAGEPNNSGNEDYAAMLATGRWFDASVSSVLRGVIEVGGTDTDGDGLPDTLDPLPLDPFNGFELRGAGPDGSFDTPDDLVYRLVFPVYTGGLALNLTVADGPLQPGLHRFTVSSSVRDRFGNGLAPLFTRFFTVANLPGYVVESRDNNTVTNATPLALGEDPAGLLTGAGRGNLANGSDVDYWSFPGVAGQFLAFSANAPGNPAASGLEYQIFRPDGARILDLFTSFNGDGQSAGLLLPTNGTYSIAVSPNYGFFAEYRLRVLLASPPIQIETEDNGTLAGATPITLAVSGDSRFGSMAGLVRTPTDLDYVRLGPLTNGSSVFLNVRVPALSGLKPVVSVYNAANVFQAEAGSGRASDGVAEVRITQNDTYYAVVRGTEATGGPDALYVLDVQVVPTGTVSFPNLQVTGITLPTGTGIQSGQSITFSFTVQNVGSLATPAAGWFDRAALSLNTTLGDGDDIPAGFLAHNGALNPGDSYSVPQTFKLPEGISGDFYIIVQADAGNAVNEFLLEADNITVSSATFPVTRAAYPDLKIENFGFSGPDSNRVYTVTWSTANRGTLAAPGGFKERLLVRNLTTGSILVNAEQVVPGGLAISASVPQTRAFTASNAASYLVQVTTDSADDLFEFDAISHASAEQNSVSTNFQIIQLFAVTTDSNPSGAGSLTGAGNFPSGSIVTVTAVPNTNALPYQFVNWTETGVFQSSSPNYTFLLTRARQLTASFTLPSYQLTASNQPPAGGTVSGQGTYFFGTTNVLAANPNAGYRFEGWSENGALLSLLARLTNVVTSNRVVVANYSEANTFHVVTTATSPTNVAAVTGAGLYTNGQAGTFSAPAGVTNPPNAYFFREFRQNGVFSGGNRSFGRTFSTLDPTNLQYTAVYDVVSLLPLVTNVLVNQPSPAPATTNLVLTLQFNRSMRSLPEPAIVFSNAGPLQPTVPPGGVWSRNAVSNDNYTTPPITLAAGMDGTNRLFVSGAQDLAGGAVAAAQVLTLLIDATPPPHPVLTLTASNSSSATVSWASYVPTADVGAFRAYLNTAPFTSVAGLFPVVSLGSGARSLTYSGLTLDRPYYAAVAAVDQVGNSALTVAPLSFVIPSTLPPPAAVQAAATGPASALVSWPAYNTGNLLGFAGFRLYYEQTNFSSVNGLTVRQTLGVSARSVQLDSLDRTRPYYFAVVGFNGINGFNPSVATARWADPFAGAIAANLSIGGPGQERVDILASITVVSNATLTVQPGTTLRFAAGAGLTVEQGRLFANGTALDPIVLTSLQDGPGGAPAAGSWGGVTLGAGAGASLLRHVFLKYGAGLAVNNSAPTVDAFTAVYNQPAGLNVSGNASLNTASALLQFNDVGAQQQDSAQLVLRGSVLKGNGTNALNVGAVALVATQNWWGTAASADVDASIVGNVIRTGFLLSEPPLTPALGTSNNLAQTGTRTVPLRLACRNAESMRVSEDSTFFAVFFAPFTNQLAFDLSEGGGLKTVFAQFRTITGQTSAPVSVSVSFITAGPVITSFSLGEGQLLSRPLSVSGAASAPLGVAAMEFYVDNIGVATNSGGSFFTRFDLRGQTNGVRRVKLLARDTSGNIAVREVNVVLAPLPPPPPAILTPGSDLVVNSNTINIRGTAEPLVSVRLTRLGAVLGTTTADAGSQFSFPQVSLLEGNNPLVAVAFDALGSSDSPLRNVVLDSGPPAALLLDPPFYLPNDGLTLHWQFAASGERATRFRLFWHTASFTTTNQATGQSALLSEQVYRLRGIPAGTYYFSVVGYDDAGNPSALSPLAVYNFDPSPPAFNIGFDKAAPVGVGPLRITLVASEALAGVPSLTLRPQGAAPVALTISNTALNTYEGTLNVTPLTPSGVLQFTVAGQDLAGNLFNGAPSGPGMVIDVTPPTAVIATAPAAPVQVTNSTAVSLNLQLSEPAKPGATPQLTFSPPTGGLVPVALSGAGSNWNGTVNLTPAMGSGNGAFALTVPDALDNLGQLIRSGGFLEIYNTSLPSPPAPVGITQGSSLPGGAIRLAWGAVSNAEIYRLYRLAGTNGNPNQLTNLVADNLTATVATNVPPADGIYRYAVTASRRGAEGTNGNIALVESDRTPPPAPLNVAVQLVASGVQVTWQPGPGELPARFNVYRNGTRIRTVSSGGFSLVDGPPRGVMAYSVAAADTVGNEAFSAPASIELLVGAVNNLVVLLNDGQAPYLSWSSSDPTAVGYNVYRNGVRQNATPLGVPGFLDPLGVPAGQQITYAVRAVNATNAESAPRVIDVSDALVDLAANLQGGQQQPLVTLYFDKYQLTFSNRVGGTVLPINRVELRRTIPGAPFVAVSNQVGLDITSSNLLVHDVVLPAHGGIAVQSVQARVYQETDLGGSTVVYQRDFTFGDTTPSGTTIEVVANQQPLAGGLLTLGLRVYNRGFADMDLLLARNGGAAPGELSISVRDRFGQEVSRLDFQGVVPGMSFTADGRGYLRVAPGGSANFQVPGVLVPEALGTNATLFQAVFPYIHYQLGTVEEAASGPLVGSMLSTLAVTPYYGLAQTDRTLYANDDPVVITGQAINRTNGLPMPNHPLKIGFAIAGNKFFQPITTDASGNFQYLYRPPAGLSGTLKIWAAHPDVFDVLNQSEIKLYRAYLSPARAEIRMSKNDRLQFNLTLINPGDELLTGFNLEVTATRAVGTDVVPTTNITAVMVTPAGFTLGPRSTEKIRFELQADLNAPDNAQLTFQFRSAEGANAQFNGILSLLPAQPLLTVMDPLVGYAEVSVDRGGLVSRTVTLVNRGLRELSGVTLRPPTNVLWMTVNLPAGADGLIPLPDMPVGSTNRITVVFAPPAGTPLEFFQDQLVITGTNSPARFPVDLFALVTSSQKGSLKFYVDNILVEPVPNATIRVKNTILNEEYTVSTDANGFAQVDNLQEGPWAWQVNAAGHSANVGVAEVTANQVELVDTRLSKSLVTVNFTVVPVPFTDRYEIVIEQTFETHVPAPVLVLTPPNMDFKSVGPGFDVTFVINAKNYGLILMSDVVIKGMNNGNAALVPLINYVPILRAQESIDIPFRFVFVGNTGGQVPAGGGAPVRAVKNLIRDVDENGNITGGVKFPPSFADHASDAQNYADCATGGLGGLGDFVGGLMAIANACAQCQDLKTLMALAAAAAVTYSLTCAPSFSPTVVGLPACPSPETAIEKAVMVVFSFLFNAAKCAMGGDGGGGGGSGNGGGGPGTHSFTQYSGGSPGCFEEGTAVYLADGTLKPIEAIHPGDRVRTGPSPSQVALVREVQRHEVTELSEVSFAGGSLRATLEHQLWLDGAGWTAARQVQPGDWLMTPEGRRARVTAARHVPGPARVYTLVNEGDHAFYANGVLVRDQCGPPASVRVGKEASAP